jgi:alpha-beta hydrolase superfamily lysophospholipase
MELPLSAGLVAEADYWPGQADLPAVLILHGFLQTRGFPTVRRLAEALADEGFSVLTPTLSLGLSRRRQSVACEAIHSHSMDHDVAELRAWTQWLIERTGKPPVLIGHSTGGIKLAALLDAHRDLRVERAVLISLAYFGEVQGPDQLRALRARATADLARDAEALHPYALAYCERYVTTPGNLLSYLSWDKQRLKRALTASAVPVSVIYGGSDKRVDTGWLVELEAGKVPVRRVAGANHFFDLAHEFELLDEVLRVISEKAHG